MRLWLLRLAVRTPLIDELGEDWPDPQICAVLKVPHGETNSLPKLRARLQADLETLESSGDPEDFLSRNLERLGERLKLTPAERAVIALAAHAASERAIHHALQAFEDDDAMFNHAVAVATGTSPEEVLRALGPDGTLRGARMIRRDPLNRYGLRSLSLAPTLLAVLRHPGADGDEILSKFFGPTSAPAIFDADDFPHLAGDIEIVVRLLQSALRTRARGVNFLLHGPPGTGKTELSRVLAKRADTPLYEVSVSNDDGDQAEGSSRLQRFSVRWITSPRIHSGGTSQQSLPV